MHLRVGVALLAASAVLGAPAAAAPKSTSNVDVDNFSFTPTPVMIHVGDTVHFTWVSGVHSTTSGTCGVNCTPDGRWDSGISSTPDHTFDVSAPFMTPGTYHYFCSVHLNAMQGDVVVNNPTSVTFTRFSAQRVRGGAAVTWRTQSEVDVLGYVVYRQLGAHRTAVSNLLVVRGLTRPAVYRFVDRGVRSTRRTAYLLQIVHMSGARTWFGTAALT